MKKPALKTSDQLHLVYYNNDKMLQKIIVALRQGNNWRKERGRKWEWIQWHGITRAHVLCLTKRNRRFKENEESSLRICWEDGTTFLLLEKGIVLLSMDSTNAIIISDIGSEKKTCREEEWAEEGEELRSFWGEQERERTSQKESEEKKCSEID